MDGVKTEEEVIMELAGGVAEWDTHLQIAQMEMVVGDREHHAHIAVNSPIEMRCIGSCQRMQHQDHTTG